MINREEEFEYDISDTECSIAPPKEFADGGIDLREDNRDSSPLFRGFSEEGLAICSHPTTESNWSQPDSDRPLPLEDLYRVRARLKHKPNS